MYSLAEFFDRGYVPSRLDLSESAAYQHRVCIDLLNRWHGKPLQISDLSEDLLRSFLSDYLRSGKSPSTVNAKRRHLLAVWQEAFEQELLSRPPRRKRVPRARESRPIPQAFTLEQVAALFRVARNLPGESPVPGVSRASFVLAVFAVFYDTGARYSEVARLAPSDVSTNDGTVLFRTTKQGRPRLAALHTETVDCLWRLRPNSTREHLFTWPYTRKTADARFHEHLESAGIPHTGKLWHRWRVTSATLVEQHGGDGAKHIDDTRQVFERHYRDPRFLPGTLDCLPRPPVA